MNDEYIKARDAAAHEFMRSKNWPLPKEKTRIEDFLAFGMDKWICGADWGHQYESPAVTRARYLEIIREWKHFWMNQRLNGEDDHQNYFGRAFGVDSNMVHHLADMLTERAKGAE